MTEHQAWLSKKYILYRAINSSFFIGAVWLFFYRLFITDQQVGVLDGIAFTIGLFAEVPSGALADKFGRDKLTKIGQIIAGFGLILQGLGSSFTVLVIGQSILMIGLSFVSGADDALFYKNLNFDEKSVHWRKLLTQGAQASLIGALIALILGGWLHEINPRIPWIVNGLCFITASLIIWTVKDTRILKTRKALLPEIKDYFHDIKTGFMHFMSKKLWFYVPFIIAVQGLFYANSYGLLRVVLLDRFHFNAFSGSIVIASSSLITVILLHFINKHSEKVSEKKVLSVISIVSVLSLLLSLFDIGYAGYIVVLALYAGNHILHPVISEVLNHRAPEEQRATVLSVSSFFRTLPYIALAPIIGFLNSKNALEYFLIIWSAFIILAVIVYILNKRGDSKVEIVGE